MGWNDRLAEADICDECEDCIEECTEHEEPCGVCGYVSCACDAMYESWKDEQAEMYRED